MMTQIETNENLWGYAKRLRFVRASIDNAYPNILPSDITILDVGCGSGTQLGVPLARSGYRLTGVDTHQRSIEMARELAEGYPNANFVCGPVDRLEKRDFDVVILSEVLEHVADPEALLRSSIEHLRPDGLAVVTVPNGYGEFEWDSWIFRGLGFERLVDVYLARRVAKNGRATPVSSTENQDDRHIQFFTLPRLRRMFAGCGLRIVDERASTLLSGPLAGHTMARFSGFIPWNARISDRLPMFLASGWFFALRRQPESEGDK